MIEATLANYKDKKNVRVECTLSNRWFSLVPTLISLNEHMKSKKHTTNITVEASHDTVVLRSGTVGRPKKPTNEKSQQSLSNFLPPITTITITWGFYTSTSFYFRCGNYPSFNLI